MPAPLLRRPAPAPYFHPLLKIFQIPPPPGEGIKIYFFPLWKKGDSPNYESVFSCYVFFVEKSKEAGCFRF